MYLPSGPAADVDLQHDVRHVRVHAAVSVKSYGAAALETKGPQWKDMKQSRRRCKDKQTPVSLLLQLAAESTGGEERDTESADEHLRGTD